MKNLVTTGILILGCAALLPANTITFLASGVPSGGNPSQPADASAIFVTSKDTIQITLENLEANPTAAIQLLSDISFTIDNVAHPTATLSQASGTPLTIDSTDPHPYTLGSPVDLSTLGVHWTVTSTAGGLHLAALTKGPVYTIIGPANASGDYANANSSLLKGHNPFLQSGATFTLTVPGVTADSSIGSAVFSFNTEAGYNLTGTVCTTCGGNGGGSPTPEPMTLMMTGSALVGLAFFTRRSRQAK